jgi:hypothetical protein
VHYQPFSEADLMDKSAQALNGTSGVQDHRGYPGLTWPAAQASGRDSPLAH